MAYKTLREYICEVAFPVGTVYMTTKNLTADQVGQIRGGTWVQLTDCFLIGAGSATDAQSISMTFTTTLTKAGQNTITRIPPHTHGVPSSGAHGHTTKYASLGGGSGAYDLSTAKGTDGYHWTVLTNGSSHSHSTNNPSGYGDNNIPYTYSVNMYYKTAL